MPTCAKCAAEYDDDLDGCPRCAGLTGCAAGLQNLGCFLMLVPVMGCSLIYFWSLISG